MRAIEDIERALEDERVFELCGQVEDYLLLLDAAHAHRHARSPRLHFWALRYIEYRREKNGLRDPLAIVTAAFWALVPPDQR